MIELDKAAEEVKETEVNKEKIQKKIYNPEVIDSSESSWSRKDSYPSFLNFG